MGFTGGGAVVLLCGLAFPDKRNVSALVLGIFAAERGIFWPGGIFVSCGFGVGWCRIFDNLVLKKEKRGRRGLVRALRILLLGGERRRERDFGGYVFLRTHRRRSGFGDLTGFCRAGSAGVTSSMRDQMPRSRVSFNLRV